MAAGGGDLSRGQGRGRALTFQSHGLHLRGLALIALQLPLGNRRRFPQVEKGAPAAHWGLFHFVLGPPPVREKHFRIEISKGLPLLRENEQVMGGTEAGEHS